MPPPGGSSRDEVQSQDVRQSRDDRPFQDVRLGVRPWARYAWGASGDGRELRERQAHRRVRSWVDAGQSQARRRDGHDQRLGVPAEFLPDPPQPEARCRGGGVGGGGGAVYTGRGPVCGMITRRTGGWGAGGFTSDGSAACGSTLGHRPRYSRPQRRWRLPERRWRKCRPPPACGRRCRHFDGLRLCRALTGAGGTAAVAGFAATGVRRNRRGNCWPGLGLAWLRWWRGSHHRTCRRLCGNRGSRRNDAWLLPRLRHNFAWSGLCCLLRRHYMHRGRWPRRRRGRGCHRGAGAGSRRRNSDDARARPLLPHCGSESPSGRRRAW